MVRCGVLSGIERLQGARVKTILEQLDKARTHIMDCPDEPHCDYCARCGLFILNHANSLIDVAKAAEKRIQGNQYPDTNLHTECCACMHATMSCNCGADGLYEALSKLNGGSE